MKVALFLFAIGWGWMRFDVYDTMAECEEARNVVSPKVDEALCLPVDWPDE